MYLLLLLMNVMHPCWIKALILLILTPDFWVIQYVLLQMCTVCTGCDTHVFSCIMYRFTHLTLARFMGLSYNSWEYRWKDRIPWRVLPERLHLALGDYVEGVSIKTSRPIQEWVIHTNIQWPVFRHRLPAKREALFLQEQSELDCFKSV